MGLETLGEEVEELGHGGFGVHVAGADGPGALQPVARGVAAELDRPLWTLTTHDDDHASLGGLSDDIQQPRVPGRIPSAVALEHEALQRWFQVVVEKIRIDSGKDAERRHPRGLQRLDPQGTVRQGPDAAPMDAEVDTAVTEGRAVR